MAYHPFFGDTGSCEVLYLDGSDILADQDEGAAPLPRGWYWWACFPGCLPDGEINGPFRTEVEAMEDAGCVPPGEAETVNGERMLRVTSPLWGERRTAQVWHDGWRGADRVLRFTGECVTCGRATFMFDDGENDPRGILGDHAGTPMRAADYDSKGTDIPQCFMCANEEPTYRAALELGRRTWTRRE